MSYDIRLCKNGEVVTVVPHQEGGTYCLGGTDKAELNVTYNYSKFFYSELDKEKGISWLYGKSGKEVIQRLEEATSKLGTERDPNYWEATPGNAGFALSILLAWAKQHPGAVFDGD